MYDIGKTDRLTSAGEPASENACVKLEPSSFSSTKCESNIASSIRAWLRMRDSTWEGQNTKCPYPGGGRDPEETRVTVHERSLTQEEENTQARLFFFFQTLNWLHEERRVARRDSRHLAR